MQWFACLLAGTVGESVNGLQSISRLDLPAWVDSTPSLQSLVTTNNAKVTRLKYNTIHIQLIKLTPDMQWSKITSRKMTNENALI